MHRDGTLYTKEALRVYDHDFQSLHQGEALLYGIYDVQKNKGWIHIGTSKDTSEFVCDSIRLWWEQSGQYEYPQAHSILALADGGEATLHAITFLKKICRNWSMISTLKSEWPTIRLILQSGTRLSIGCFLISLTR